MEKSAPARVITVSSNVHAMGQVDFDDLQGEASDSGSRAYNHSKLANVLLTYELARRLQGSGVTPNALHPGLVITSLAAEDTGGAQRLFVPFVRPFLKSPTKGAATSVYLASGARPCAGDRLLFRKQQAQKIVQAHLLRDRCGSALAGERRPGRPGPPPNS